MSSTWLVFHFWVNLEQTNRKSTKIVKLELRTNSYTIFLEAPTNCDIFLLDLPGCSWKMLMIPTSNHCSIGVGKWKITKLQPSWMMIQFKCNTRFLKTISKWIGRKDSEMSEVGAIWIDQGRLCKNLKTKISDYKLKHI